MPELAEVEAYRRLAETATGRPVATVDTPDDWYLKRGVDGASLTTIFGLPRSITSRSSSRATRVPESEVSATSAKNSRVQSSTTVRMRKRRPSVS